MRAMVSSISCVGGFHRSGGAGGGHAAQTGQTCDGAEGPEGPEGAAGPEGAEGPTGPVVKLGAVVKLGTGVLVDGIAVRKGTRYTTGIFGTFCSFFLMGCLFF